MNDPGILQIPNAFAPVTFRLKAFLVLKDECHNKINDDRGAESKKRKINKIHTDMSRLNTELLAPPFAHAECLLLKPIYNLTDHFTNIGNLFS